ncbi:unnamed protein product [Adineta ricciae]|uniref:Cyclin-like domain-containing protein n=1 Tax=Adineta ricciae TaxID=249248 RepID=A0A815ZPU4_ADIRI|nr:unnamed protein product [Adineta ricciae]
MEQQQLVTMLSMEKLFFSPKSVKSHLKRHIIANSLHKLCEDEKMSDDVFALTMNIFDRFVANYSLTNDNHYCELIALSCYNLAKKLRANILINKENEITSLIFQEKNYQEREIFDAEQLIIETLDWDLSTVVSYDYIPFLLSNLLLPENDLIKLNLHVRTLLSLAICVINTLTILPSVLCCACIREAIKGLSIFQLHSVDELILQNVHCNKADLFHTQCLIEQIFQSCLQAIRPSPPRRCLAPIDTSNKPNASPRVK